VARGKSGKGVEEGERQAKAPRKKGEEGDGQVEPYRTAMPFHRRRHPLNMLAQQKDLPKSAAFPKADGEKPRHSDEQSGEKPKDDELPRLTKHPR